jgi:hypothetical protein
MKKIFFFVALLAFVQVHAQQITDIEFFFDNDPGKGNGTAVTVATPAAVINDLSFTASTASLANGMHTLFTRSKDNLGNWSNTNKHLFVKQPITVAGNITKLEYFFDNDPGFGNAIDIPSFPTGTPLNDFVFTADATALSNGPHFLYVRSKDDWSITNKILFYKQPITVAGNITKLEYFFDNDPGFGNATNITGFTPGTTINDFVFTADATALSNGPHFLYVRSKDDWSITNKILFYKEPITFAGNITKLEYFFDNDPGFGNATNITGFTPGTTINDFVFTADATALSNGPHFLYVRSKDDWSITNKILFYKEPLTALTNITQIEYFIDKDPGFGNGTQVVFTPTNPVSDLVFSANFSGYTVGTHYFFARSKDANGRWSLTNAMLYNQTVVLPLNWISFIAKKVNTTSLLEWRTANEQQVAHFEIERSTDGILFEKIGTTIAKNGAQNDYVFIDIKPIAGKNYYRIKQIDIDGKFSYTSIDVVDFGKTEKLITIINNPSNNPIIKIVTNKIATLSLFDATGKLVHKQSLENIYNINIGNVTHTSGQYIAVMQDKNELVVAMERIVVMK